MKRIVRATGTAALVCAALLVTPVHAGGPEEIEFGSDFFEPVEAGPVDLRPFAREGLWFFRNGSPTTAEPGVKYEVRVRSFAAGDESRHSGLSPAVSFKVDQDS